MKITQDEVVDNQTTLHIELEDADLAPYLDRGYRRIADRVAIPGFRRGKAPRRVVEQALGREQLLSEVLDSMAYETADKAIAQRELDAAAPPKIEKLDMQDQDAILITATVPLKPEVTLGDYRATRIDFSVDEVTDEQVDDQIESIRQSMGNWEEVERPARFGDLLTIDMTGYVEGGEEGDSWGVGLQSMYLAEDGTRPLPGFSARLVGAEAGDVLEFTLIVPDNYPLPGSAGKPAHFTVNVYDVMERILPALDDDFARSLPDGFANVEALRVGVLEALINAADAQANSHYREQVISALVEGAEFILPPVMVEREADHIVSEQFGYLERNNIRKEDYLASVGRTEDDLREEAKTEARRRVSRSLALTHLAEIENVEPTEAQITERFNSIYAGARLRRRERGSRREGVQNMLRMEQAIELLASIAKGEGADGGDG